MARQTDAAQGQDMHREKIARAMARRPRETDFRGHLFWLVDIIYACKATGDPEMQRHARLLEDALGALGSYLETGVAQELQRTQDNLEAFSRFVTPSGASLA